MKIEDLLGFIVILAMFLGLALIPSKAGKDWSSKYYRTNTYGMNSGGDWVEVIHPKPEK